MNELPICCLRNVYRYTFINLLKPTSFMYQHLWHLRILRSAPTLFIYSVFISEETATSAPYNINWLVFITEMKSFYCAVRTGSLNKTVCASSLNGYLRFRAVWRHISLQLLPWSQLYLYLNRVPYTEGKHDDIRSKIKFNVKYIYYSQIQHCI